MENLAFENYKSFIETADCVQEVNEKIVVINNNVVSKKKPKKKIHSVFFRVKLYQNCLH